MAAVVHFNIEEVRKPKLSRPKTGQKMVKISSYFSQKERDTIDQYREDMSRSLFIRRAIRKVITDEENNNDNDSSVGGRATNHTPAAVEAVVEATSSTTKKEVALL